MISVLEDNAMKLKNMTIKVNPNDIKVRDEGIKQMIATQGGVARVFKNRKKAEKTDKVGRKAKYRDSYE